MDALYNPFIPPPSIVRILKRLLSFACIDIVLVAGLLKVALIAHNVGALRRRVPKPVSPWCQLNKDTKAGHLYCRSSVILQPGSELDLETALEFKRQPLAQNPLLCVVIRTVQF